MQENDNCGRTLKCVGHNKTKENDNFIPRPTEIAPHVFNTGTCYTRRWWVSFIL